MAIEITDDGKGFTATIRLPTGADTSGHFSGEIVGYGATEDEARQNATKQAEAAVSFIARAAPRDIVI